MRRDAIIEALTCMWHDTELRYKQDYGHTYPVEVTVSEEGLIAQKRIDNENSQRTYEVRMSPAVLEGFRQAVRGCTDAEDDEQVLQALQNMLAESYDRYWKGTLRRGLHMGLTAGAAVMVIVGITNGPLGEAPPALMLGGAALGFAGWLLIYGRRMKIRQLWGEEGPKDAESVLQALEKTDGLMK